MSGSSGNRRPPQRGLHTLRDLQGDRDGGRGGRSGDADSDDSDDQDFFAGGEKSGLAVQGGPGASGTGSNPRDQIDTLLDRARRNVGRPGGDDEDTTATRSNFTGAAQTLGGDDAPSQHVPDPLASMPRAPQRVSRTLHLWSEGFSVDDGPLHRFDDPANQRTLDLINQGRAPPDVLHVETGQEVDLQVHPHQGERYQAPKQKYRAFAGEGQRLGSPVPSASTTADAAPAAAPATSTNTNAPSSTSEPTVALDASQPTLTLQIRLGDGTRLTSRFNPSHTVGDIYNFVDSASAASRQREYALMTTFPSVELSDRDVVLGEKEELKKGGVVVQKWK